MKKVILILAVAGIFILSLNSCARSCKGGMCPSWSSQDTKSIEWEIQDFRFIDRIFGETYNYKNNEDLLKV